ncbi:MAG: Ig-like domain repeat protein [Nitrospirae bacterium]|nr:Ig-like domain repeat protein [Candidatus Manganitrophaceae bacterium]
MREDDDPTRDRTLHWTRSALVLLIFLLFFFPSRSHAAGKFIPFEKIYTREEGEPAFVENTFSVNDPRAPYTLQISNEASDPPAERASGWEIQVNGVSIMKPTRLDPKAPFFEKAVTLQSKNTVKVKLKGKRGGKLTVHIVGADSVPPQLSILSPADGLLTRETKPAIRIRYSDATAGIRRESFRALLNGKEITSSFRVGEEEATYLIDSPADSRADSLADGSYTLLVSIADAAENRAEARVAFQVDATPPESRLAPTTLPNASGWSRETRLEVTDRAGGSGVAEVHYQLGEDPEVLLRLDAHPSTSEPRSVPLPLSGDGKRTLRYYAVDRAGNREAQQQQIFQIDHTPPRIKAIVSPPPNEFGWHRTNVTVSFEGADDLSGLASVTPPILLTGEGENQLAQGIAVDRAGNEGRVAVSVWIDKSPPSLSLDSVHEGAVLSTKVLPLSFLFADTLSQVRPDRLKILLNRVDLSPVFTLVSGQATKTITLGDRKYTLTASIEDRAGNKTELTRHFTIDTTPPELTLTSPGGSPLVKDQAVRLAGRATDATTSIRSIRINGMEFPHANGEFSVIFPLANEGSNKIKVEAIDEAGNIASKEILVTRATRGPQISNVTPAPGVFTKASTVTVSGKVEQVAAAIAAVTLNGSPVSLTPGPSGERFSVEVPLTREGKTRIEIVATDTVGHQTAYPPFDVVRDTAPPAIEIRQPSPNASVATSPVTVTGQIQDAAPITSLFINGNPVAVQENHFSAEIPLEVGENTLSLSATDPAGNSATLQRRIFLDNAPPQFVLTSPADDRPVGSALIRLAGRVVDPISGTAAVRINGKPIALTAAGEFAESFPLTVEGENRFELVAVDPAGNTARMNRVVVRDTRLPELQIVQPTAGAYTNEPTLSVMGTAADPGGALASVAINEIPVSLIDKERTERSQFKTVLMLNEGENFLRFTATDTAGNSRLSTVRVVLDTRSPVITIERPLSGSFLSASPIILSGSVTDRSPIASFTLNGAAVPIENGSFRYPVVLVPGANLLTLTATDAAGNTGTLRWQARLDDLPPQIVLTTPADRTITRERKIQIAGKITDEGTLAEAALNGRPLSLNGSAFVTDLPLVEGENRIVLSAKDLAGNRAEQALTVVRDTTPPEITVTFPAEQATLHLHSITVRGTIDDPTAKVTVNGIAAEVSGNAFIANEIPLPARRNEIIVLAVDAAGNERRIKRTVLIEEERTPTRPSTVPSDRTPPP